MGTVRRYLQAILFGALAVTGFVAALVAAYDYGQTQSNPHAPFLLLDKTYDVFLPFLLTTVAVGAAGAAYAIVLKLREKADQAAEAARTHAAQTRAAELARRAAIVERLRAIYDDSLRFMYDVRFLRQRVRIMAVKGADGNGWYLRRSLFDEMVRDFSAASLNGRRLGNMLKFDLPALCDGEPPANMLTNLQSQVGAIFGILKNALDEMNFAALTQALTNDEALVLLPPKLVAFVDNKTGGDRSFRKGAEQYDAFVAFVIGRLRAMEEPLPPA